MTSGIQAEADGQDAESREQVNFRRNKNKMNSAVMQGILQGETIPEISHMNEKSAVRNARTMTASAMPEVQE